MFEETFAPEEEFWMTCTLTVPFVKLPDESKYTGIGTMTVVALVSTAGRVREKAFESENRT
jgi:hypothetical protein